MEEVSVPPYFVCPISLEIMKDPVTVPTGITYDRESIERWLFTEKNAACPVTKQPIADCELTPNHTLRRLIQSWCTMNASKGVERIPTPKSLISKAQILRLLSESKSRQQRVNCLAKLRSIGSEHESNKHVMKSAGAVEFLASMVIEESDSSSLDIEETSRPPSEEALSVLHSLQVSDSCLGRVIHGHHGELFIDALAKIMRCGSYESRAYAVVMLKMVLGVADPGKIFALRRHVFVETVEVLRDQISPQAMKSALKVLIGACPWGRNRSKAVEANAVHVAIDLLLETTERRSSELILSLLDILCQCAEGRAELVSHAAGLAIVSKKILRVSEEGSEKGVRIIYSIAKYMCSPGVLQEMLQVGVVAKLCLILQVSCGKKMKEKAKEILKLHGSAWKDSPCIPAKLVVSYPS